MKLGDKVSQGTLVLKLEATCGVAGTRAAASCRARARGSAQPDGRRGARRRRAMPARRTSSAMSSCLAPGRAVIPLHSGPQTWA